MRHVLFLALLFFWSCTATRVVTVETVRTDTLTVTRLQRDSIFVHTAERDSVALTQRGDTILIDRWHTLKLTEYRDRWLHDSIYVATHDTIPQPYPVEVKVAKPLTRWQQFRLWLGNIVLAAIAVATIVLLAKKRMWFLRFFK